MAEGLALRVAEGKEEMCGLGSPLGASVGSGWWIRPGGGGGDTRL